MARRILNFLEGLLNLMTMLIIVVVGAYAGYALWDNQQIYSSVDNVQEEMLRIRTSKGNDDEKNGHGLYELQNINPDVKAWLTLDNTRIDYPVLQAKNNFKYLNLDVYGNHALSGSIYLDSRNNQEFSDQYNLVHGHHMANGRMFGDLDLYKDKAFFDENRTGLLTLPEIEYNLLTFACVVTSADDDILFRPDRWLNNINEPLQYIKSKALHMDKVLLNDLLEREKNKDGVNYPKIVVLATCSTEYSNARTMLFAEMIPVEETE